MVTLTCVISNYLYNVKKVPFYLNPKLVKIILNYAFFYLLPIYSLLYYLRNKARVIVLLQNNLRGGEMLFEFVFQTTFLHLGGYSATNTVTSTLFLFYHGNKIELIVSEEQSKSILNKTAFAVAPS